MVEKQYWGKHGEYGPFSIQADGWPHRGEVLRAWRKMRGLSAKEVGYAYGTSIKGEPVSERWVTMAEKWNLIPQNEQRRRILADVVGIPPLLFGLGSLEDLLQKDASSSATAELPSGSILASFDVSHYESFLLLLWQLDYASTAQSFLPDIGCILSQLSLVLSERQGNERMKAFELLCGFYPLASTLYNDQCHHEQAFLHADTCVRLAEAFANHKLLAVAYYQRGFIALQRSILGVDPMTGAELIHHQDVNAAIDDFERALPLAIPRLEAAILLDLAYAYAIMKRRALALVHLDKAEKIIRKGGLEDGTFVDLFANLDRGRFHLGKAVTLLELQEYQEAEDELDLADEQVRPEQTRRHAWIEILRARVYIGQKNDTLAAETVLHVFKTCESIHSLNTMHLIQRVYTQLSRKAPGMKEAKRLDDLKSALTAAGLF